MWENQLRQEVLIREEVKYNLTLVCSQCTLQDIGGSVQNLKTFSLDYNFFVVFFWAFFIMNVVKVQIRLVGDAENSSSTVFTKMTELQWFFPPCFSVQV